MTGGRRRELADSFRLLGREEQWLLSDLLIGTVAFVLWVAATALLATKLGVAVGVPLSFEAGDPLSTTALAFAGVLWVAVPALAGVVHLRKRLLNLRGNVEQHYRFDYPATLLAAPLVVLVGSILAGVAFGRFPVTLFVVLFASTYLLLVRTLAYSYRVYSFSHPLVVLVAALVTFATQFTAVLQYVAAATGRQALVDAAITTLGLPSSAATDVGVGGMSVPASFALATLAPLALVACYLGVQSLVSSTVWLRKPSVDRSKMRTGQRYPPFLDATAAAQTRVSSTDGGSQQAAGTETTPTPIQTTENAGSAGGDDADADLDDVSHTRVFRPPSGGDDVGVPPGSDSVDVSSGSDDVDVSPGSDDDARDGGHSTRSSRGGDGDRCDACGTSFDVDMQVSFCPNCGTSLE